MNRYSPAERRTLYFIGVTTSASSIMKIFGEWAKYLNLGECEIKGMDFLIHAPADEYFNAVKFIKNDPLSLGALVTTHKLDLLKSAHALFDWLDPYAKLLNEVSCVSKRGTKLEGHAKDAVTADLALSSIVNEDYWIRSGAELFCIGAGGANLALTTILLQKDPSLIPGRIVVSDKNTTRLKEMSNIHQKIKANTTIEYIQVNHGQDNDNILVQLSEGSLIANGTGVGKDIPGSPFTDQVQFPVNAIVWDYNYRGDLTMLKQAMDQKSKKSLTIVDGWEYFIHGWTRVISEVFEKDIPTAGNTFDDLSKIANSFRV